MRNRGAGGVAGARKRELERCQIYLHPEAIREYHAGPASDNDDDDEDGSEEEDDELASASKSKSKSRRGKKKKHQSGGGGDGAAPIERLVITLYHSHGLTKTHRLTFSLSESLLPVLDLSSYSCTFSASASLLRAWMDHFHIKPGSGAGHKGGGTDEVSLYCEEEALTIKSFASFDAGAPEDGAHTLCPSSQLASVAEPEVERGRTELPNVGDSISHRPLFTEVMVDVGDFELWSISGMPIITFALKEFKVRVSPLLWLSALFTETEPSLLSSAQAIVALATELNVTLDAHFDEGGKPLVVDFVDDSPVGSAVAFARAQGKTPSPAFIGQFVVTTTAYDSRTPKTSASSTAAAAAAAAATGTKAYGDSKVFDKFKKKPPLSSASSSKAASSAARQASSSASMMMPPPPVPASARAKQRSSTSASPAPQTNPPQAAKATPLPLFNPPSQQSTQNAGGGGGKARVWEEDDEFGMMDQDDEDDALFAQLDFDEIDRVSQLYATQKQQQQSQQEHVVAQGKQAAGKDKGKGKGKVVASSDVEMEEEGLEQQQQSKRRKIEQQDTPVQHEDDHGDVEDETDGHTLMVSSQVSQPQPSTQDEADDNDDGVVLIDEDDDDDDEASEVSQYPPTNAPANGQHDQRQKGKDAWRLFSLE